MSCHMTVSDIWRVAKGLAENHEGPIRAEACPVNAPQAERVTGLPGGTESEWRKSIPFDFSAKTLC